VVVFQTRVFVLVVAERVEVDTVASFVIAKDSICSALKTSICLHPNKRLLEDWVLASHLSCYFL